MAEASSDSSTGNTNATATDPKSQGKKKKKVWTRQRIIKLSLIFGVVIAGAIFAAVIVIQQGRIGINESNVRVTIEGPQEMKSGEMVNYDFIFTNENRFDLLDNEIIIIEPADFWFESASEGGDDKEPGQGYLRIDPGTIEARSSKTITVTGIVTGRAGAINQWKAKLEYQPQYLQSKFETSQELDFEIAQSDIVLEVSAPRSVASGEEFEYEVIYRNRGTEDLNDLEIRAEYSPDFNFLSSDRKPDTSNNIWDVGELAGGERGEIKIRGYLIGEPSEAKVLQVKMGQVDSENRFVLLNVFEATTSLVTPSLLLTQKANVDGEDQGEAKEIVVNPKDLVVLDIEYKNISNTGLSGVVISDKFLPTTIIDESTIKLQEEGAYQTGQLTWNSGGIPPLAALAPGAGGSLRVSFRIKDEIPVAESDDHDFRVDCQLQSKAANSEIVYGNTLTFKLQTELTLDSQTRYTDDNGQTVGSGPIPPRVDQQTIYRVYWRVYNATNDSLETKAIATLPTGVTYEGGAQVSTGQNIEHQPLTGEVVWDIGRVPANTGKLYPYLEASFNVSIVPAPNQVGEVVTLLKKQKIIGRDGFTDTILESLTESITTSLSRDPQYEDLDVGEVQP